jgi:hypothetical protein
MHDVCVWYELGSGSQLGPGSKAGSGTRGGVGDSSRRSVLQPQQVDEAVADLLLDELVKAAGGGAGGLLLSAV